MSKRDQGIVRPENEAYGDGYQDAQDGKGALRLNDVDYMEGRRDYFVGESEESTVYLLEEISTEELNKRLPQIMEG